MNHDNVRKAIAIMKRAGKVNMGSWLFDRIAPTEGQLHECGMPACFGGYVAVSPEFQEDGGHAGKCGEPILGDAHESQAIAVWLDIGILRAKKFCCEGVNRNSLYGKSIGDITKEDVIEKLEELLNSDV